MKAESGWEGCVGRYSSITGQGDRAHASENLRQISSIWSEASHSPSWDGVLIVAHPQMPVPYPAPNEGGDAKPIRFAYPMQDGRQLRRSSVNCTWGRDAEGRQGGRRQGGRNKSAQFRHRGGATGKQHARPPLPAGTAKTCSGLQDRRMAVWCLPADERRNREVNPKPFSEHGQSGSLVFLVFHHQGVDDFGLSE